MSFYERYFGANFDFLESSRPFFKVLKVIFWMGLFILHGQWICWCTSRFLKKQRQTELISYYSRRVLLSLGYKVDCNGVEPPEGSLIIANHLSYLDILVIASLWPCVFVTSTEMRDAPILGRICKVGGSIFVNRRRHFVSRLELNEIACALTEGHRVVVFPEATSTNGDQILPFKRGLFRAAEWAGSSITSLCIRYRDRFGYPVSSKYSESRRICFYGEMEFFSHLLSVADLSLISAAVDVVDIESPNLETRKTADLTRHKINRLYQAEDQPSKAVACLR